MNKNPRENFSVGKVYRNRKGKYVVLEKINNGYNLVVQYENGDQEQLGVSHASLVMEAVLKEEKEKKKEKLLKRLKSSVKKIEKGKPVEEYIGSAASFEQIKQYYRSLGFLARNAFMYAFIAAKSQINFDEKYFILKNKYPENNSGYTVHGEEVNKYSYELRLAFNLPENRSDGDIVFGPEIGLVSGTGDRGFNINNNDLCWYLLYMGFELGKNHNIDRIESRIPNDFIKYFEEGL